MRIRVFGATMRSSVALVVYKRGLNQAQLVKGQRVCGEKCCVIEWKRLIQCGDVSGAELWERAGREEWAKVGVSLSLTLWVFLTLL